MYYPSPCSIRQFQGFSVYHGQYCTSGSKCDAEDFLKVDMKCDGRSKLCYYHHGYVEVAFPFFFTCRKDDVFLDNGSFRIRKRKSAFLLSSWMNLITGFNS